MRVNFRRSVNGNRAVTGFVVGVIATMTIGGGVAIASIPSSSTAKFTGCVSKAGGDLRIIDAQAGKKCRSSEKTISWSKGWTHRGAWASGTAYKPGDVVTHSGSSYVATVKSTAASPASNASAWGLLAAAGANGANGTNGAQGAKGDKGDQGDPGPVTLQYVAGSPVNVPSGSSATDFSVACPTDLHAISGGASISGTSSSVAIRESYSYDTGTFPGFDFDAIAEDGWGGWISNTSGSPVTATPFVVCSSATSIS